MDIAPPVKWMRVHIGKVSLLHRTLVERNLLLIERPNAVEAPLSKPLGGTTQFNFSQSPDFTPSIFHHTLCLLSDLHTKTTSRQRSFFPTRQYYFILVLPPSLLGGRVIQKYPDTAHISHLSKRPPKTLPRTKAVYS